MKNCLSKVHYLLLALLVVAMTGCGANKNAGLVDSTPGGVAAKLNWSASKTLAAVPAGVAKVRLSITGVTIPAVRRDFDASATSASVPGVVPGKNLTVFAQAFDASGVPLFEGAVFDVAVTGGQTTDVGTINMIPAPPVNAADAGCLSCHEITMDRVTGRQIIASFKQSRHYQASGAGCNGCHGSSHNDLNPAASGKCFSCHVTLGSEHQNPNSVLAGDANPARYLNATNSNCNACHEPHNPLNGLGKQERKDWAASGHGNVAGAAWAHYDFTVRDTCNACHTPKGFIKAMGNGWTDTTAGTTVSTGKQPLTCDACHSSYDFKNSVRNPGAYLAGMSGYGSAAKASIQFANVGESNVCIPCHAGRENGASINAAGTTFANVSTASFKNPHYLAAAAVFYGKGGFQFYTSGVRYNTYGAAGKIGRTANWSHGKLGMDNFTSAARTTGANVGTNKDNAGKIRGTGDKGQCVACHLGPTNVHSFGAYDVARVTWGTNSTNAMGCFGCHSGEDMEEVAIGERANEDRALDFLAYSLEAYGLYFNPAANPYFFTSSSFTTSARRWNADPYSVGATGKQTMGAALNLKLLEAEKGSHVHNRAFMRALINDSLVYLQKGPAGIAVDRTAQYSDINSIISFTAYSTAVSAPNADRLAGKSGSATSISGVKSYLTRKDTTTGKYYRR